MVLPEGVRVPLPCAQLPELVLNAVNTIAVSLLSRCCNRSAGLCTSEDSSQAPTLKLSCCSKACMPTGSSTVLLTACANLLPSSASGARQRGQAGGGDGVGGGAPREQVCAHPGAAAGHEEGLCTTCQFPAFSQPSTEGGDMPALQPEDHEHTCDHIFIECRCHQTQRRGSARSLAPLTTCGSTCPQATSALVGR